VRRISKCLGVLAAIAVAGFSVGPASAAAQPGARTKAQWQGDIAHVRQPGTGCYRASYPVLQWHAVKCITPPNVPLMPAKPPRPARHARPALVGNGTDYAAQVTGLISEATGTFQDVSPNITEQGQVDNTGPLVPNAFTLQLNTQTWAGSPMCAGSSSPANCSAWQQFIYGFSLNGDSAIFIQYWLLNYDTTCPSGWITSTNQGAISCFKNSKGVGVTTVAAESLPYTQLTGSAQSGGNDAVSLTVGTSVAASVSNTDSMLDLAKNWNSTEWGVFGDYNDAEADFGANTTLSAQTVLTATSNATPKCPETGYTGERNNLSLASTPALPGQSSPTIESRQTNDGSPGTAHCSPAAGAPPPQIAFTSNANDLWYYTPSNSGHRGTGLGVDAATSPSMAPSGEVAFQGTNNHLWLYDPSTGDSRDTGLGMEAGSSPSIVGLAGGGYEIAFQANTGILWLNDPSTGKSINTGLGMDKATSPSITPTSSSYEVAFQANNNDLWYYTPSNAGDRDTGLGMDAFTSPSIMATASGTPEIAFQANNNDLWYYTPSNAGDRDTGLGMETFSSPAIAVAPGGVPEIAFEANNDHLWYYTLSNAGDRDTGLGMASGTDPSITVAPGGVPEIAFEANTGDLYYYTPTNANDRNTGLGMASGTSPAIQLGT
jgi:uncharacterized protein YneR